MSTPIKYTFLTHTWLYKDEEVLDISNMPNSLEKRNKLFIKVVRKFFLKNKKVSEEEILKDWIVIDLPKSNTFPKFNNEIPFKLRWNSKWINNPKILGIRWNGYNWEYELEHIGHKYSFQHEDKLQQL